MANPLVTHHTLVTFISKPLISSQLEQALAAVRKEAALKKVLKDVVGVQIKSTKKIEGLFIGRDIVDQIVGAIIMTFEELQFTFPQGVNEETVENMLAHFASRYTTNIRQSGKSDALREYIWNSHHEFDAYFNDSAQRAFSQSFAKQLSCDDTDENYVARKF